MCDAQFTPLMQAPDTWAVIRTIASHVETLTDLCESARDVHGIVDYLVSSRKLPGASKRPGPYSIEVLHF